MKKWLTLIVIYAFLIIPVYISVCCQPIVAQDSGLEHVDLRPGTGATVKIGSIVVIHVTGWLNKNGQKGVEFINTYDLGKPMAYKLGTQYVMKALNEGVKGMQVGGKRRILVPAKFGYGAKRVGDIVPPNADLILEVEVIDVE